MIEGVKHSGLLIFFFCGDVRFGGDPPLGSDNNSKYLNPYNLKECSEYQMSTASFQLPHIREKANCISVLRVGVFKLKNPN